MSRSPAFTRSADNSLGHTVLCKEPFADVTIDVSTKFENSTTVKPGFARGVVFGCSELAISSAGTGGIPSVSNPR